MAEPGQHRVADRVRDVRFADQAAVRSCLVVEGAEQLLDMEGNPVRPFVDGGDDVLWGGQLPAEDQRGCDTGFLERQLPKADLLGLTLAEQPRAPLSVERSRVRREVLNAIVAEDQKRSSGAWRASSPSTSRLISSVQ